MKSCIIDVGGGNRGVYGAGVFERCLDDGIEFDYCLGVSAGSANVITYLAGQKGRLFRFYHDYAFRKEYMGLYSFFKTKSFINLDYIYSTLTDSDGEDPLDIGSAKKHHAVAELVISNARTGKAEYVPVSEINSDDYWCLKASCCIPFICRPQKINNTVYFDGGITDPVPIERALENGCEKIVLVLSKPVDFQKKQGADRPASVLLKREYPELSEDLFNRAEKYNKTVSRAKKLEKEGKCLIVAPDDCCGVGTIRNSPESSERLYRKGYNDAAAIKAFLFG